MATDRRRLVARLSGLAVAALLATAAMQGFEVQPASATAAPAQTYNMCGDYCKRQNTPQFRVANSHDKVIWFIGTAPSNIWYIGLTEACSPAVAYIAFHLPSGNNYKTHHFPDDGGESPQTASCAGNNYGNASIEYGTTLGANTVALATSDDMHCVTKQGFGFQWRGCVIHLKSNRGNPTLTELVKDDLAYIRTWWDDHPGMIFLAGDFNLEPGDVDDSFNLNDEIDSGLDNTALMATNGNGLNRKIDYVLGRGSFFPGTRFAFANDCDAGYSDHCYLRGYHYTS